MSTLTRATARKKKLRLGRKPLPAHLLSTLAQDIRGGAVVIFPTETVYGIGASVFARDGIRRIYTLKGRQWRKPLAVLVPTLEAARPLVEEIPAEAFRLAKRFWPGPLTLIFKASPLGRLVTGGLETLGVRIPDHPVALDILKAVGIPMAVTSVNRSGEEPATSGAAADRLFGARIDWMIDGGVCRVKTASSVIDLSHYPYTVIRHGAIHKREVEEVLNREHSA